MVVRLALRLAAFRLLRRDLDDDPILVLDDVFAELDAGRRRRLAADIVDCEQVLITAAVPEDVPAFLQGARVQVRRGHVEPMTDAPVEPSTQRTAEPSADAPSDSTSDAPVDPSSEPPTQSPSEPTSEPTIQSPSEPGTAQDPADE